MKQLRAPLALFLLALSLSACVWYGPRHDHGYYHHDDPPPPPPDWHAGPPPGPAVSVGVGIH